MILNRERRKLLYESADNELDFLFLSHVIKLDQNKIGLGFLCVGRMLVRLSSTGLILNIYLSRHIYKILRILLITANIYIYILNSYYMPATILYFSRNYLSQYPIEINSSYLKAIFQMKKLRYRELE